jgi:hypothetical protein
MSAFCQRPNGWFCTTSGGLNASAIGWFPAMAVRSSPAMLEPCPGDGWGTGEIADGAGEEEVTMTQAEQTTFVAKVVDDAERMFGAFRDPALLEAYAREATLDLWLTETGLTVAAARQVLHQVRDEVTRRGTAPAGIAHCPADLAA